MSDTARAIRLIKAAKPFADAETIAALGAFAPAVLTAVATSREPWHLRRPAIRALAGRVDDAAAKALLARALDRNEVGELRCDALDVLSAAGRTEATGPLRRLRAEIEALQDPPHGLEDAVASALARLGDIEAAVPALRLRYDGWSHRRHRGEEAVRALELAVGIDARARAILALLRRGLREEAKGLWDALKYARIELPGVPPSVRRAVLYHYLPGERGTDARWLLEGELDMGLALDIEREEGPDEPAAAILEAARRAVHQAGCSIGKATPIGHVREQGGGTYCHLQVESGILEVSELGRFVAGDAPLPDRARDNLERAGFVFVEGVLASQVFEGLGVYFFGRRDPLSVYDLLFYWQD